MLIAGCEKTNHQEPPDNVEMHTVRATVLFGTIEGTDEYVGEYRHGDTCTLTVEPYFLMYCDHWSDETQGPIKSFVVTQDTHFWAYCEPMDI